MARGEPGAGFGPAEKWDLRQKEGFGELLEEGESATSFLLRYTITHSGMQTTIVGTLNPDHLKENVAVIERGPLSAEVYAAAKSKLSNAGEKPE